MNKTVCIYHSVDLDGWMSAAIVKYNWMNNPDYRFDTYNFIGYNYGNPIPDLSEYDKVIMVDISFPKEEMQSIQKRIGSNFVWIDHHISAMKEVQELFPVANGWLDTHYAACELTWKFFFPEETMPEIVRLLGRYDCFGHKGTDEEIKVLEFQYGARQCITNYEDAYRYLYKSLIDGALYIELLSSIKSYGKAIYQYLCTEAKQIYDKGFVITFWNHQNSGEPDSGRWYFLCVNRERFNPINFGIDYHKEGYDGFACFHYENGMFNYSLYNDNGKVDVSLIAKQFGGGGHKGASGFRTDKIIT